MLHSRERESSGLCADISSSLGDHHRDVLPVGADSRLFHEFMLRPIFFRVLIVGHAGDAVFFPHLLEKGGTVSFPIKDQEEPGKVSVFL